MNVLDYIVVSIYLGAMLAIGFFLKDQKGEKDYFLGGRDMGWFPLSLSTMATQLSAISFISAPAFVGLREGGGLKWLTYELGVPLAMIFVMFVIAPALYRANVVSIYDYLEKHIGKSTRVLISILFQIVRSFSTGIMVYAPALILEAVLGIPLWQSIVAVGVIALVYSVMGGMKAVVYSDAIQMFLIFGGLLIVAAYAYNQVGGMGPLLEKVEADRLVALDFSSFGFSGDGFGFIPMLFGGFILYISYYGCDQTQAQRVLSSKDLKSARTLLLTNGLLRFPLVLVYCFAGLIVGVSVMGSPELMAQIPSEKLDFMMPVFVVEYLPHGLIGLIMVAVLSAAMSSVSSAMNSLAAVSLEDMKTVGLLKLSPEKDVQWARYLSILWGVVIIVLAFFAGEIAPTVIEAINKVGSALYGPVLGVFLIAIFAKKKSPNAVNIGLLIGLLLNLYFWKFVPDLFWMWWNVIGLIVTVTIALLISLIPAFGTSQTPEMSIDGTMVMTNENWRTTGLLIGFFMLMIVVCLFLPNILNGA